MSRLCNLRFCSIIKGTKHTTTLVSKKSLRTTNETQNVFHESGKGYAHLYWKFEKHIYPLYKCLDIIRLKEIRPLLTRMKILRTKYDINHEKKNFKSLGFVLGGIGITIVLCEAKNHRGMYYLYHLIAYEYEIDWFLINNFVSSDKQFFRAAKYGNIRELTNVSMNKYSAIVSTTKKLVCL